MYTVNSLEEKILINYTCLNLYEVQALDIITYLALLRDAVIYNNMQTEEGREYLYNCWRMGQTEPQREALRKRYGKGEG